MQLLSCDLWLMDHRTVNNIIAIGRRLGGIALPEPRTEEKVIERVAASTAQSKRQKSIAVIPVSGALEARPTEMGAFFGMSSYEVIGKVFDHFVNDETVSGIILDVSSPGGMVYGAEELANKIYSARGSKPIVAVANPLMASGAFWLGAAADRVVVTPSGDTGSVGVITEHVDLSKAYEKDGATVSVIKSTASPYKGEMTDAAPLSDESRQHVQHRVDVIAEKFIGDLAKFRGVSVEHVKDHFGKGRVVDAKTAVSAGMADRVGTFEEIRDKMLAGRIRIGAERAQDDWNCPTRRELLRERASAIMATAGEVVA